MEMGGNSFFYNKYFCANKTDRHDITEILLKVVFNTINPNLKTLDVVVYCKLGNKFVHEKVR
jgi:hypothetical protein